MIELPDGPPVEMPAREAARRRFALDGANAQAPRQKLPVMVNGKRVKTIDVHAHCAVPEAMALLGRKVEPQTLLTSLVDAAAYPAAEIIGLYHERWEIELGYGEVKTVMLAREETTRSRTPRGVSQELWGLALAYNLVRLEMERIAVEAGVTPDRISFKGALMCIEHALLTLSLDSAGRIPEHLRRLRADVAHFILPKRRHRSYPRAVKIKMSNYPRKRRDPK